MYFLWDLRVFDFHCLRSGVFKGLSPNEVSGEEFNHNLDMTLRLSSFGLGALIQISLTFRL